MRLKKLLKNWWTTLWYRWCYDNMPLYQEEYDSDLSTERMIYSDYSPIR
jgi:hypothetical protein